MTTRVRAGRGGRLPRRKAYCSLQSVGRLQLSVRHYIGRACQCRRARRGSAEGPAAGPARRGRRMRRGRCRRSRAGSPPQPPRAPRPGRYTCVQSADAFSSSRKGRRAARGWRREGGWVRAHVLLPWPGTKVRPPSVTGAKGEPEAYSTRPSVHVKASSAVHLRPKRASGCSRRGGGRGRARGKGWGWG